MQTMHLPNNTPLHPFNRWTSRPRHHMLELLQVDSTGGHGRTGRGCRTGRGGGQHQLTPFAKHMRTQTQQGGCGRGHRDGSFVPTDPGTRQLHHQHHTRTSLTSIKALPTGTCATHACSTSKTDTHPSPAPQRGADPATQKDSHVLMHKNTSTKGGIHAPKQCTRQNSWNFN